uniref:Serine-threonine/tyrosine-protein kinase catalytic domain-containing protein n=1 Tax=Rhizophagus irregularis (strain DAOM 181602 / DAOM 197198 / MUCL 43194) TaxID=747089 RepID=U9UHL2_RHIID
MRPKIISEIPSEYKSLMEQCWDADPLKRPDIDTLRNKMNEIMSYYQNKPNELPQLKTKLNNVTNNNISSKLFTSKIHKFENLPEPKNATEEEQEAFHSKLYDFSVPYNIDGFGKANRNTSKISSIIKDNKDNYNKKIALTQNVNNDEDEDEVYNNPNLHSEEQDEFEIPDGSSIL